MVIEIDIEKSLKCTMDTIDEFLAKFNEDIKQECERIKQAHGYVEIDLIYRLEGIQK